jgi:hypothetical protein
VDMRFRGGHVLDDPRQQRTAVDEQLDAVAAARRERATARPTACRCGSGTVAVTGEPPPMVRRHRALDRVPEDVVDPVEREHGQRPPGGGGATGVGFVYECAVVVGALYVVVVGTYEYDVLGADT